MFGPISYLIPVDRLMLEELWGGAESTGSAVQLTDSKANDHSLGVLLWAEAHEHQFFNRYKKQWQQLHRCQ